MQAAASDAISFPLTLLRSTIYDDMCDHIEKYFLFLLLSLIEHFLRRASGQTENRPNAAMKQHEEQIIK